MSGVNKIRMSDYVVCIHVRMWECVSMCTYVTKLVSMFRMQNSAEVRANLVRVNDGVEGSCRRLEKAATTESNSLYVERPSNHGNVFFCFACFRFSLLLPLYFYLIFRRGAEQASTEETGERGRRHSQCYLHTCYVMLCYSKILECICKHSFFIRLHTNAYIMKITYVIFELF